MILGKPDGWASLVAQMVKRLPAVRETWARSLGWEDPLEREMATYSSTLAWKVPWTEEPGRLQSVGSQSRTRLSDFSFSFQCFSCFFPTPSAGSTSDRRTGITAVVTRFLRFLSSDLTGEHMQSHGFIYHFLFDDMNLPFLS